MSVTYDLYVKQSGRWLLEKQFNRENRSDAVSEANRLLALPGIAAARVIRERYDRRTQIATEHTVFDSTKPAVAPEPTRPVRRDLGRRGALPPDVHRSWNDEPSADDEVPWDDTSLFDEYAEFEPWHDMSDRTLDSVRDWTRKASICVCGGSVALLFVTVAMVMN